MREKIPCIYKIQNIENGNCYIGSTIDFYRRIKEHRTHLETNKHHSTILQNSWNKYGEYCFVFEILEIVKEVDRIAEIEQTYLDEDKPYFNVCKYAYSVKERKQSKETIEKIARSTRKPIIQYDLDMNFIKEWESGRAIVKELGVSCGALSECCKGKLKTVKGFIFKFKDNFIPFISGSRKRKPRRKHTKEEFIAIQQKIHSKSYSITFADRNEITVTNLSEFCRINGYNYNSLASSACMNRTTKQRITVKRLEIESEAEKWT